MGPALSRGSVVLSERSGLRSAWWSIEWVESGVGFVEWVEIGMGFVEWVEIGVGFVELVVGHGGGDWRGSWVLIE